ncbi:het domain-containing protein [Fusarium globosum]|uniref:Het domain-containing protein n=1 Tax=Fusarium globosum TaxID=78864 RepID=A0A8H6DG54_9HYPO|nr:het domain-containing protein [Fusarium globosum]
MGIAASQAGNDSDKPSPQDMSAETVTTPSQPTTIQNIPPQPTPKSPYLGLRRGKSSIRFIRIEPVIKEDDPVRCELSEIPFTEKPRFRALSYRWGRPSTDYTITLNGISVRVRQNLWEALRYLRKYEPDELYWIDALCINQDDIIERSQQVSVMHRIYFKAQIVVVWLGSGYAKYKTLLPGVVQARYYKPQVELPENSLSANDERQRIALELYNDDYWSRLWIVQEIGLAHEIRVCYGNSALEWSEFIDLINLYNLGPDGPMKFQRMREDKGKGSHTLLSLMERHKDALCEDRKDKVYGLIGMSSDARGHLTIDYAKSMFQIWSEVMQFIFPEDVTIAECLFDTARFVKILLMGTDCANSSQIPRLHSIVEGGNSTSPVVQSPRSFGLDAAYLGRVTYVGPTPHDAVGDLDQLNEWERQLNETYEVEANDAHQESDALIWAVEKLDDQILAKRIFDYESTVHWSAYSNERVG